MKLIRECRMGLPKQFKTGAVVGTYPKPLLYLGFDRGGLDIIPLKSAPSADFKMDVTYEDIVFIKPDELASRVSMGVDAQPKVLAIDFSLEMPTVLPGDYAIYQPTKNTNCISKFQQSYNNLCGKTSLPWKTIVLDSLTGFSHAILSGISSYNPNAMADARQWAFQAGTVITNTILSMTNLPLHVVILLHSNIEQNELTKEIRETPNLYGKGLREDFFALFSQCFYAVKDSNGKPKILTTDKYPVKGIGCRWPQGLPAEMAPDFVSIYGKELA